MTRKLEEIKKLAGLIPGVNKLLEEVQIIIDDLEEEVEGYEKEVECLEEKIEEENFEELDLGFGIIYYQAGNLAVQSWLDDIQISIKGHALH